MSNLGPQAEPIAWANVAALLVAALIQYGIPINDPLGQLLVLVLPFVLANGWARFKVYAPDTHDAEVKQARAEGRLAGYAGAQPPSQ